MTNKEANPNSKDPFDDPFFTQPDEEMGPVPSRQQLGPGQAQANSLTVQPPTGAVSRWREQPAQIPRPIEKIRSDPAGRPTEVQISQSYEYQPQSSGHFTHSAIAPGSSQRETAPGTGDLSMRDKKKLRNLKKTDPVQYKRLRRRGKI